MSMTIVVPVHNAEATLAGTIDSVLEQSCGRWNLILVDDGSTDRSGDIIRACSDPRISAIGQVNKGASAARNLGLADVRTDHVLFLDADDKLHPTAIERLSEAALRYPNAIGVFGTSMRYTTRWELEPGQKEPHRHRFNSGDILRPMLVHDRVFWNGGQVLIKTAAARHAGGYSEALRLGEDWEFFCRLAALGEFVFIGPQAEILRHQVRPDSTAPMLSPDWSNHQPAIATVFSNAALGARFAPRDWEAMRRENTASGMFEAGRQNFIQGNRRTAFGLMLGSVRFGVSKRRLALLALAVGSVVCRRPLHGQLRPRVRTNHATTTARDRGL